MLSHWSFEKLQTTLALKCAVYGSNIVQGQRYNDMCSVQYAKSSEIFLLLLLLLMQFSLPLNWMQNNAYFEICKNGILKLL